MCQRNHSVGETVDEIVPSQAVTHCKWFSSALPLDSFRVVPAWVLGCPNIQLDAVYEG